MNKPEPTRRQKEKILKSAQFRCRMDFIVEFDHPVTIQVGRETARKLLDALNAGVEGVEMPEAFGEASLKCSELRRVIKLRVEPT